MRRSWVTLALACAAALAAVPVADASAVYVVQGRGYGHGIGMSQWGAYGYARHGWTYPRILRHYYPGTTLGRADTQSVRVLLADGSPRATIGCAAPLTVSDGTGRTYHLPAAFYSLGSRLKLPVGHERVRVKHRGKHHHARFRTVTVRRALRQPLVFDCAAAPLTLDGAAYHGRLVVRRAGGRLAVVDTVALEDYVRGVVAGEMPSRWSLAALEAQAVAARTYALATLKPDEAYDLYADTRSQVYGGIAYETTRTNLAVARTAGRIVTWQGRPAATFFFSTSGGRTAAIRDVWPRAHAVPYLRSVSDPYDARSPHHRWGPIAITPAELRARLRTPSTRGVRVEIGPSGRAAAVDVGGRRIVATRVEARLGLPSTWFRIGLLSLRVGAARLVSGNAVTLTGTATGLGTASLQARAAGGRWHTIRLLRPGRFAVRVSPQESTRYRIASRGVAVAPVAVAVAPRLRVEAAADGRVTGTVSPRPSGAVEIARRTARGWHVVAHPQLDARGSFSLPLRADGAELRVSVAGDDSLASATSRVEAPSRYLASVGP